MSLGKRGSHERGGERGASLLKRRYSTGIGSSNEWLQIGKDVLLIITSTGDELLKNVNIDDLE